MFRVISWNIARRATAWRRLTECDADVALLQEATEPPPDVADSVEVDGAPWRTDGEGQDRPWRTAVVKLSSQVEVEWLLPRTVADAGRGEFAVSRLGTLAAARITPEVGEPLIVVSLYGTWEKPHAWTGSSWIYADASVHRLVSDLSIMIGQQSGHRIIAAGDLNILNRYGEHGSAYWGGRYSTVFDRMSALGLPLAGPQMHDGGRQADPWPDELPRESKDVPTYHTNRQTPATATRQLDFVFASSGLADQIEVRAINEPDEWGPSDHCRLEIRVP